MVRQVPAQFSEVVRRLRSRRSWLERVSHPLSFVFISLQTPFPATPLLSHSYETLGVSPRGVSTRRSSSPCLHAFAAKLLFSVACRLLFSLASLFSPRSLYYQALTASFAQTPGGGRVSPKEAPQKVSASFAPSEGAFWSRMGLQDVQTVRSLTQRRRRLHIQLSLLQAQGSQVHG
jgi:hypothetical protein